MLREEQLAEIREADNRIARRVFLQEKTWAKTTQDTVLPRQGIDLRSQEIVTRDVARLDSLLESKQNAISFLLTTTNPGLHGQALDTFLRTGDIAQVYNQVARVIVSPLTTSIARQDNKNKLNTIADRINTIVLQIRDLFRKAHIIPDKGFFTKYSITVLNILVFYRVIQDQLITGAITPITSPILQAEGEKILAELDEPISQDIRDIINETEQEVKHSEQLRQAFNQRIQEEEQDRGRSLLPEERRRIAIQVYGENDIPSYLNDDLNRELLRQEAEEEKHQLDAADDNITPLADNPAPTELSQRLESIADTYQAQMNAIRDELQQVKDSYKASKRDNNTLEADLNYIANTYLELQERLAVYQGEALDLESAREDLVERYDGLFDNPRESAEERKVFASALSDFIKEVLEDTTELFQYQQQEAVQDVQTGFEGFGRKPTPFYWRNYNLTA